MKNPPILISVLGFFAALAGFAWLFFGLRLLGFDWFGALGDLPAFEPRRAVGLARHCHGHHLGCSPLPASGRCSRGPAWFAIVHGGFRAARGCPGLLPVPGDRRRLRYVDPAGPDPLVPDFE